jgi:cell wall-associated NlpC family hydrolase
VEPPKDWGGPFAEVTDLWANLRGRASSTLAAVTQAVIGTRLPVASEHEKWIQLLLPSGKHAWTESHRVRVVGDSPLRPCRPRAILATARRFLGIPYLWGGCSPVGIDCSGFMQLVMRLHGIDLQRDASMQARQGAPVAEPDIADLVFFGPVDQRDKITHVGMMLDRSRFIHAAGSDRVRINQLSDPPYAQELRFGRRFITR